MNTANRPKHTGTRPFIGKGIKFYLPEWSIVSQLQDITGLNFTDIIKLALSDLARKHGLTFPGDDKPERKAS